MTPSPPAGDAGAQSEIAARDRPNNSAASKLADPSDQEALELEAPPIHPLARIPTVSSTSEQHYGPTRRKALRIWRRHVSLAVPHVKCRDHLANERTFLGYLRSGLACSMLGVFIAQLMRINHDPNPNPRFGFFQISVPLSSSCHILAIVFSIVGFVRFLRYQKNMALGTALSGGWEITLVGGLTFSLLFSIFVLALSITIDRT